MGRLWIDVEDVYWFFHQTPNPSGIQRLSIELIAGLREAAGATTLDIRLCRCDSRLLNYRPFSFEDLTELVVSPPCTVGPSNRNADAHETVTQINARRSFLQKVAAELRRFVRRRLQPLFSAALPPPMIPPVQAELGVDLVTFAPGDTLLCLGAHWIVPGYARKIAHLRRSKGIHFAFLCYDLIPITGREWFPKPLQAEFQGWFDGLVPHTDLIMTISQYTADQVKKYLTTNFTVVPPVRPIRTGHGFPITAGARLKAIGSAKRAVTSDNFVLFVSTIEIRKNHVFLLRVWKRLLATYEPHAVPDLVFVGRHGWCVEDLYAQLENSDYFGGKVRILTSVVDEQLVDLYRRCRLTIYPSLEEGWGLPIAEAVMFGAICLASNKASIPEVAGDSIDYFDPDNLETAYQLIERAIYDESYRSELASRISRFRARSWAVTANDTIRFLQEYAGLAEEDEPQPIVALAGARR
jgi:glycosyltransferase involved in cell wall biosynthesis